MSDVCYVPKSVADDLFRHEIIKRRMYEQFRDSGNIVEVEE